MNIPGSGESCVICSTVRFLFLCSSVPISLFGLASFFFFTSFLLYFPLCFSSFHPPSLCLSLPSVLFFFFLPFFTVFRSSPSLDLLSSLHSLPYSPFLFSSVILPSVFLLYRSPLVFFFFFSCLSSSPFHRLSLAFISQRMPCGAMFGLVMACRGITVVKHSP
ncbi:hypothetical protein NC652_024673 [Populus alba x Populus x berolinensis]|nr:hypothetical protein NC652_024673 [Populus alba x Populus x berolinensis]